MAGKSEEQVLVKAAGATAPVQVPFVKLEPQVVQAAAKVQPVQVPKEAEPAPAPLDLKGTINQLRGMRDELRARGDDAGADAVQFQLQGLDPELIKRR